MPILTCDDVLSIANDNWKFRRMHEFFEMIQSNNSEYKIIKPKKSDYQKGKYFVLKTKLTKNISPSHVSEIRLDQNNFVYCVFVDENITDKIVNVPSLYNCLTEIKVGTEFKKSTDTFEMNIENIKHVDKVLFELSEYLFNTGEISQDTFNILNGIEDKL